MEDHQKGYGSLRKLHILIVAGNQDDIQFDQIEKFWVCIQEPNPLKD